MRLIAPIFAAAFALSAGQADATGMNATEFSTVMAFEDIDLTTQDGLALLDQRIKTIVRQKCANGSRESEALRLERDCRASAHAAAQDQVRVAIWRAIKEQIRLASGLRSPPEG